MRALSPDRVAERSPEPFLGLALMAGMLASFLVAILIAWLASAMMAGATAGFDRTLRDDIHSLAAPGATSVMRAASRLGSPPVVSALAIAVAILFILRGWRRAALLLVIAVAGGGLLGTVLKNGFQRARPSPMFDYPLPDSYSFPSGHAVWSFCLLAVLAALMSRRMKSRMRRVAMWAAAAGLILLIGVALGDRVANRVRRRWRS
jgi:undecaprenyl-diphosphatase